MTKLAVPKTRILALAALGVGVVAGAAGAAIWVAISSNGSWHEASDPGVRVDLPQDSNHAPGEPWFRKQEGPPEFLTDDNRTSPALMPHRDDSKPGSTPARPYEEALPETVHLTAPSDSDTNTVAVPSPAARPTGELPPWRKFAVAVPPADGRKQIAIVIDDAGIDRKRTARAIRLPGPLTISFLTYAEDLPRQTAAAHAAGHELLVHMAMEPTSKAVDPGPNVLRISDDARSIRNKLSLGLSRFGGYVGINNHMGSRFTADAAGMDVVMAMLHERGLMFLDSRTSGGTVGPAEARKFGVPLAERNVFLDNKPTAENLAHQLAELERTAKRQGYAVAIGHPRDATLDALAAWLPKAAEKGFELVPISTIAARRMGISVAQGK